MMQIKFTRGHLPKPSVRFRQEWARRLQIVREMAPQPATNKKGKGGLYLCRNCGERHTPATTAACPGAKTTQGASSPIAKPTVKRKGADMPSDQPERKRGRPAQTQDTPEKPEEPSHVSFTHSTDDESLEDVLDLQTPVRQAKRKRRDQGGFESPPKKLGRPPLSQQLPGAMPFGHKSLHETPQTSSIDRSLDMIMARIESMHSSARSQSDTLARESAQATSELQESRITAGTGHGTI